MGLAASLPDIDDPGPVRQLGAEIRDAGRDAFDLVASAQSQWTKLAGSFQADGTEKVYQAMDTPKSIVSDIQTSTDGVKSALDDYASKLSDLQRRKRQLELEIIAAESALAAAEAMPKTKKETGPDGEEREVPNEEREQAIAEAEAELDRLEGEVQKLCDDVKSADEELAARFEDAGMEAVGKSSNGLIRFGQGARDAIFETGKAFFELGKAAVRGLRYTFEHRQEIIDAAKGLDDFVKNGGLGRMRDSLATSVENFDAKDAASTVLNGTRNWASNELQEFKEDPSYYLGRLAPDAVMTVASGGTGGLAKMGATAGAKAAAGGVAKGGAVAVAKGGAGAAVATGAKSGALAAGKVGAGQAAGASIGAAGIAGVTRSGAKSAAGAMDDVARVGAKSTARNADDIARARVRNTDTATKTGAGQARQEVSNATEVAVKRVDHPSPNTAHRSGSPSATGVTERPAGGKTTDSSEKSIAKTHAPKAEDTHLESPRTGSARENSALDNAAEKAEQRADDMAKPAQDTAKATNAGSGVAAADRVGAQRVVDEAEDLSPKRNKADVDDTEVSARRADRSEPTPGHAPMDTPEGNVAGRQADEVPNGTKPGDRVDEGRANTVAEKNAAREALDDSDDLAKKNKESVAETSTDKTRDDKPEATAIAAKESAETATSHADDATKAGKDAARDATVHADDAGRAGKEGAKGATIHADDALDKGKGAPDADESVKLKNHEHAEDAQPRTKDNFDADTEVAHQNNKSHAPYEEGPLSEARENIDNAHKPVDDTHFAQHHHAHESGLEPQASVPAEEFYSTTARERLIEDAKLNNDFDRIAELETLDTNAIRAEYHQLKFDEHVERQIISGKEFDFENNLKQHPSELWRDADIEYSINEGAYVKDNSGLLPKSLEDKIPRARGEAPDPKISVVDYVNENMREVTVQIGQNKVIYRHYPDYIESEAIVFEKFDAVRRTDTAAANRKLLADGSFLTDPETGKKAMRTDHPNMPIDEKGHLFPHMFGPNFGPANYLAQHYTVNGKTIYNMEMIQADAIVNENSFTHFSTRATLDSSGRPTGYHAIADIYDRDTGKQWLRIDGAVPNADHDVFDRNPANSQVNIYDLDMRANNLGNIKEYGMSSGSVTWINFDQVNPQSDHTNLLFDRADVDFD